MEKTYTAWLKFENQEDFEAGEMVGGLIEGSAAVGADVVAFGTTPKQARKAAEKEAKRMSFENWSAPESRKYDDLSFCWTGALATD